MATVYRMIHEMDPNIELLEMYEKIVINWDNTWGEYVE